MEGTQDSEAAVGRRRTNTGLFEVSLTSYTLLFPARRPFPLRERRANGTGQGMLVGSVVGRQTGGGGGEKCS